LKGIWYLRGRAAGESVAGKSADGSRLVVSNPEFRGQPTIGS
jgi:hypothetical protein